MEKWIKRRDRNGNIHEVYRSERVLTGKKRGLYLSVCLYDEQHKVKNESIHRLVAKTFIENIYNHKFVNHIDEDKYNNNVDNLEWCTAAYNQRFSKGVSVSLINPKNEIFEFKSRAEAREYTNISFCYFWQLTSGKISEAKGWRML